MISNKTREELFNVPVPQKTKSYTPVPHRDIVEAMEDILGRHNIGIKNETYMTNSKGTQLTGIVDLDRSTASNDFGYRIYFKNSYDKSMSVSFCAAAEVLVCSNGMVVTQQEGEVFMRKHTGNVREVLQNRFVESVKQLAPIMDRTLQHAEKMKTIEVDMQLAAELAGRMFIEEDIINTTQLNIIKKELDKPSWHAFAEPNLWSFYNHTTHALKHGHASTYLKQHQQLHSFVEAEFNL